ncbi:MAG: hypothetical protein A2289_12395 [Deltaproteobacteria bacterium RIFOXYA12_FULL_58_15]|nr:MAG: hypothetical protein A2289_12395 [Deltaproteobacteria bacterium RIFOXYA12_FULL_58_15]OGR11376.1 MAG: hypothetical protein A2341_12950 [Deltaproteobacteria bacterium RIFOXYB12_FULL_58_9]
MGPGAQDKRISPNHHLRRYLFVAASDLLLAVRQSTTARNSSLLLDLTAHLAIRIVMVDLGFPGETRCPLPSFDQRL